MTSIPRLSGILRQVFGVEANRLATGTGVIQRQRIFSGASLLRLLVFGWLKNPQGGPSFLACFAGSLDLTVSKQASEDRFRLVTATWLLAVLRCAGICCAGGCRGRTCKRGAPRKRAVRCASRRWRGREFVDWRCGLLCADLAHDIGQTGSLLRSQQAALRASDRAQDVRGGEGVTRRRERLKEAAHKQSTPISPRQWELACWVIVLTNVPLRMLTADEALALLRARWQIELLWKLWQDLGQVDEWQTANPARILCELYAKLLGMLVQHWRLLLSCWDDPHRSLTGAAQVIRDQIPILVHGLTGHLPLGQALRLITDALRGGCSIPRRHTRLSTSYRLLECSGGTAS